ncbi:PREDICTED: olfactory receptor 8S1-like [Gekko japonicus]|uniref:Olfactory receptor n=1 Tax=Gekko japonicus TaxID=146911 RepID=A0ABM1K9Y2_GEKJA|nr:PREDICTED: olfactory receptor 8S1-like [Gekko japonicus]
MENQSIVTEFILVGFSKDPQMQIFLFLIFLLIYAMTLLGNMAIMLVIRVEASLHTPMFFFLSHLAFADICYSSVTLPKMLKNFTAKQKTISREGCIAQIFFHFQAGCAEVALLSVMAYDRYVAICAPLNYSRIMMQQTCRQLVGGAWTAGTLMAMTNSLPLAELCFCRENTIHHYICEIPSLLLLSCSETYTNYMLTCITSIIYGLMALSPLSISYSYIISTILSSHPAKSRSKAFSTCSSHIIVVSLFYITAFFRYFMPSSKSSIVLETVVSIQYSILTPLLNPIIYSLKNQEIKTALGKQIRKHR